MTEETKGRVLDGIIYDMPNEEYHASEGISKSNLDLINRSPAHYKYSLEHKREPTDAMLLGTMVHTAVLEPDLFGKEYVVSPKFDKRTKKGKEAFAEFQDENLDKTAIDTPTYDMVMAMSDKVNSIAMFRNIMDGAKTEVSAYCTVSGILRKSRADIFREDGILADLKTCLDASYAAVQKSIHNFRYYVQSPYYLDNFTYATHRKYEKFIFIFVEKTPPYGVAFYSADRKMLDTGKIAYKRNLDTYKECLETGEWKDYEEKIIEVSLPPWTK